MIVEWDPVFPVYELPASWKAPGAPRRHLAALREHGPSPLHHQWFAPQLWNAPVPQDVLAFMLQEDEDDQTQL